MSNLEVLADPPPQPDIMFLNEDRDRLTLADFRGKVTVVNLWATWCPPCIAELPSLDRLEAEMGSDEFQVVAVSLDGALSDARDFYDGHGIASLAVYQDSSTALATKLGAEGVPITVIYGPDGAELARAPKEADWNSPEAQALMRAALALSFPEDGGEG